MPAALTSLGGPSEACAVSSTGWKDGGVEVLTSTHTLQDGELRVFRGSFPQTHLGYSDLFLSCSTGGKALKEGALKCDDPQELSEISSS